MAIADYQPEKKMQEKLPTIMIIGAGLSGAFAALELSKKYQVLLVEQSNQIIPETSSSYNECYKLHTGLHYAGDPETALKILEASIHFARNIPSQCIAGEDKLSSPARRGRHLIMSGSEKINAAEAKELALKIQKKYAEKVSEDPKNKIFGEPKTFIKFLEKEDYGYVAEEIPVQTDNGVNKQKVTLGIETGESQIAIDSLRDHLKSETKKAPNIIPVFNSKVTNISHLETRPGYTVTVKNSNNQSEQYLVDGIVNCAWQNIEKIDKTIGFYEPEENRVIRVKVTILVELPKSFRNLNTTIFSIGPYISFTNLDNGYAVLASEITTNQTFYRAGIEDCPENYSFLTKTKLTPDSGKGKEIAEKIRTECAHYFEAELRDELLRAPIKKVMVGNVKMMNIQEKYDEKSIFKVNSPIHQREASGIEVRALNYISVSGNKMTYTFQNAVEVSKILDTHLEMQKELNNLIKTLKPRLEELTGAHKNELLVNTVTHVLCKNIIYSEFTKIQAITSPSKKQEYYDKLILDILNLVKHKISLSQNINAFFNPSISKKPKLQISTLEDLQAPDSTIDTPKSSIPETKGLSKPLPETKETSKPSTSNTNNSQIVQTHENNSKKPNKLQITIPIFDVLAPTPKTRKSPCFEFSTPIKAISPSSRNQSSTIEAGNTGKALYEPMTI